MAAADAELRAEIDRLRATLERERAERTAEQQRTQRTETLLAEATAQQAAVGVVLQSIGNGTLDLESVMLGIAERIFRLIRNEYSNLTFDDGNGGLRIVAVQPAAARRRDPAGTEHLSDSRSRFHIPDRQAFLPRRDMMAEVELAGLVDTEGRDMRSQKGVRVSGEPGHDTLIGRSTTRVSHRLPSDEFWLVAERYSG